MADNLYKENLTENACSEKEWESDFDLTFLERNVKFKSSFQKDIKFGLYQLFINLQELKQSNLFGTYYENMKKPIELFCKKNK